MRISDVHGKHDDSLKISRSVKIEPMIQRYYKYFDCEGSGTIVINIKLEELEKTSHGKKNRSKKN